MQHFIVIYIHMFYIIKGDPFSMFHPLVSLDDDVGVLIQTNCGRCLPMEELYFCDHCSELKSRFEVADEIDSFYCPNCLENLPTSEAMVYGNRCTKCFECPLCKSMLHQLTLPSGMICFGCSYCHWNSRDFGLVANRMDELRSMLLFVEKDTYEYRGMTQRMDVYRRAAQEQAPDKELQNRLNRKLMASLTAKSTEVLLNSVRPRALTGTTSNWGLTDLLKAQEKAKEEFNSQSVYDWIRKGIQCAFLPLNLLSVQVPRGFRPVIKGIQLDAGANETPSGPLATFRALTSRVAAAQATTTLQTPSSLPVSPPPPSPPPNSSGTGQPLPSPRGVALLNKRPNTVAPRADPTENDLRVELEELQSLIDQPDLEIFSTLEERFSCTYLPNVKLRRDMPPLRKPLMTKRSKRCLGCSKSQILVKAQIHPAADQPFTSRHQIAIVHMPRVVIGGSKETPAGKDGQVIIVVVNPVATEAKVRVEWGRTQPLAKKLIDPGYDVSRNYLPGDIQKPKSRLQEDEVRTKINFPDFETKIDAFGEFEDASAGVEDDDGGMNQEDVGENQKIHRKANRIFLVAPFSVDENSPIGAILTAPMELTSTFVNRSGKEATVVMKCILSMGRVRAPDPPEKPNAAELLLASAPPSPPLRRVEDPTSYSTKGQEVTNSNYEDEY